MMRTIAKFTALAAIIATALAAVVAPITASADITPPPASTYGNWVVTTVARDGEGTRIEAYKSDRDLIAWTELESATSTRRLYAFDGAKVKLLATMAADEWNDAADGGFYDTVTGSFDVSGSLVVWTQKDMTDREIFSYDGYEIRKVSDNSYDDKHPVTSAGRIAWTSVPNSTYTLMVRDAAGIQRMDSWQVLNYAFSGKNLFWMNKRAGENWFRVFRNDGFSTLAVGKGDDRPVREYFTTDGKGSAAWEYSTQDWAYDKRETFLSKDGAQAFLVIQRDVPPNVTTISDLSGSTVVMSVKDLLYTRYTENVSFLEIKDGIERTVGHFSVPVKARISDSGYVRHVSPENTSVLVYGNGTRTDYVSLDPVLHDLFDADGATIAAALAKGGVLLKSGDASVVVPTTAAVRTVTVKNGDAAWIEGASGSGALLFATHSVLVRSGGAVKSVSGHLVKSATSHGVYFAASDGKRYVFPDIGPFMSWYKDFSLVRTASVDGLSRMPLAGPVLYRPGSRLIKVKTDPRIYAVGPSGTLNWIRDEAVALAVYGPAWKTMIDTVNEPLVADYASGQSIATAESYRMTIYSGN